ncbi:MAG: hypothetical protein ACOCPM_07670 [Bacteroidales bacterium]
MRTCSKSPQCRNEERILEAQWKSNVLKKFIDSTEHNYPTIVIFEYDTIFKKVVNWEEELVFFDHEKSGFYDYVRVGDSIIKEKNSMDIRVIRGNKDTVFTIDYGCEKYP